MATQAEESLPMPIVLRMHHVERSFDTSSGSIGILSDVDLELRSGAAIAIRGPSGCGKSTLLLMAGTLDTPSSGVVEILGENPWTLSAQKLARFRNQHVGFIFQEHRLLPQLNVLENVLVPLLAGFEADKPAAETRAKELLNLVGLKSRLNHRPAALSGGERQRVAVCRALVLEPSLLLADEPTGNLDPHTAGVIGKLLLDVAAESEAGLLCVTHSTALAESFPRQMTLVDGRLVEDFPAPASRRS
jgi:lipoprotein-releasing system ATP-binding protein